MAEYRWQHANFHFAVSFSGIDRNHIDAGFQSVTGLDVQIQPETIKEGGENGFEHVIPGRRKYTDLVLKRGILTGKEGSLIFEWCKDAFEKGIVRPVNLDVILLNEEHQPLMKWNVVHAWPKSWKTNELNAERGEVLIETLELAYNRFEFSNV
jgi:phage tail-like protein